MSNIVAPNIHHIAEELGLELPDLAAGERRLLFGLMKPSPTEPDDDTDRLIRNIAGQEYRDLAVPCAHCGSQPARGKSEDDHPTCGRRKCAKITQALHVAMIEITLYHGKLWSRLYPMTPDHVRPDPEHPNKRKAAPLQAHLLSTEASDAVIQRGLELIAETAARN